MTSSLRFGKANAKLRHMPGAGSVVTFSLPAGWTCPAAVDCKAKAHRTTGRITDGVQATYRCFAASDEARSPAARAARWANMDALRGMNAAAMAELIMEALPPDANVIRIHVSGDFYNQAYFDAWTIVATAVPAVQFYAYTKSLDYWVARLGRIPENLNLTASVGGRHDALIAEHALKFAAVVFSPAAAAAMGLKIDHDDTAAAFGTESFALLLHGTQPKGSAASAAISAMRADGVQFSYA
jgi:hypothetical protein